MSTKHVVQSSDIASLQWTVDSTHVGRVTFATLGTLTVEYNKGGVYRYYGVPLRVYGSIFRSTSRGSALHRLVKSKGYRYERVYQATITLDTGGAA